MMQRFGGGEEPERAWSKKMDNSSRAKVQKSKNLGSASQFLGGSDIGDGRNHYLPAKDEKIKIIDD